MTTRYPSIRLTVRKFVTPTELQQKLLTLIGNTRVKRNVNQIIADYSDKYVPMKSGALRQSVHVGPNTISWGQGLNYGRYQYNGVVYKQNFPIIEDGRLTGFINRGEGGKRYPIFVGGRITGWYSLPGVRKVRTERELGVSGEWRGWTFGYTTPGTKHHWLDEMLQHEKRGMQIAITNYLKSEAKNKDL